MVLIPPFPAGPDDSVSQVLNGMLLPFILIFMIKLVNQPELMGEWVNPRWFNVVAWVSIVLIIGLTLAYVGILVRGG